MNDIFLWCVTGMSGLVALNTIWRLWSERERLSREDLTDEDRAFAWRVVIFLLFPLLNFIDLRATVVACDILGGYIANWSYGFMWFHVAPAGLKATETVAVYSAGAAVQLLLALLLLPALLFRPHPFLATLIGYSASFIFGLNLIIDPILSAAGMGSPRWPTLYNALSSEQRMVFAGAHIAAALLYLTLVLSQRVRLLFAGLSRPYASDELKKALNEYRSFPDNPRLACWVGILYDRAGLRRRAGAQLKKLKATYPRSLYAYFLEALLSYKRRDYQAARKAFIASSDFPAVDGTLKANLLAAAACAAFAQEDVIGALNLSERALEFDDYCTVARMVKVDVFLRQGKKEQAGEEILLAMREGVALNLEKKVPLDINLAFEQIASLEERSGGRILAPLAGAETIRR